MLGMSGAYLFVADGPATKLDRSEVTVMHSKGKLIQQTHVTINGQVSQTIK